jgi:hypothetical protein
MAFPKSDNFSKHSENLRNIDKAVTQAALQHKRAIRENDLAALEYSQRIHEFMVGVRAECALRKIVSDPIGFNDREREIVWSTRTQVDRWLGAVDLSARRHYRVPIHRGLEEVLSQGDLERVSSLSLLLKNDLSDVIEGRNKIAHGQWVWLLKSGKEDKFLANPEGRALNYVSIAARHSILRDIADAVHILAVSEPTFKREFGKRIANIEIERENLGGDGYQKFAESLRSKRFHGSRSGNAVDRKGN